MHKAQFLKHNSLMPTLKFVDSLNGIYICIAKESPCSGGYRALQLPLKELTPLINDDY